MRKKTKNNLIIAAVAVGVVALLAFLFFSRPSDDSPLIAARGLHWHPTLTVIINGEQVPIPANVGLGIVHNPIHTHDDDGVVHLEFTGPVRESSITLGKFFEVWSRTFNSECIFEFCNGSEGTMTMMVNGVENNEFQHHSMRDGEMIEILYE